MALMNRRQWLQSAATAALGYALRPYPLLASAPKAEYFPRYVDVGKEAGVLAKTVIVGHGEQRFPGLAPRGRNRSLRLRQRWLARHLRRQWLGSKRFSQGPRAYQPPL